jgi:hypothetical protein
MAKLHIYKKVGNTWTKIANGDGTVSTDEPFTVTLSSGSVTSGNTYDIRQGQSVTGDLCNCTAVNGNNATFSAAAADEVETYERDVARQSLASFYAALDAVSKAVTILVDLDDLATLKTNNYAMCFAKKVASGSDGGSYNVVWQSLTKYVYSTAFSWTPQFSLFGTNVFADTVTVTATTNQRALGLGQQCLLDANGILQPPATGGPVTGVSMQNQFGLIHPALSQISTLNGVQQTTPLYVAPSGMVQGSVTLTPIDTVMVWFQQDIATSTMFSSARSMSTEIDLTSTNTATRLYKGGQWSTPS